jgi:hypothetical protein
VLKGKEEAFWEILDRELLEAKFGGEGEDVVEGQYWPPVNLESDVLGLEEIKSMGLMTFDFLGH